MGALAAQAQPVTAEAAAPAAAPRTFGLSTGLTLEASAVDTRGRASGSGTELVLRASPSLTLANSGSGLRGSLIYSGALINRRGITDREENTYLNSLSSTYLLEAIEGIGFVDARASVSQQSISAVGAPTGSGNRNEVTTLALSPYLRGALGGLAEYELRAAGSATKGGQDTAGDSTTQQGSFFLRSPRRGAFFGWGLTGSRSRVKFAVSTAPTITDRLAAELALQPDVDWRFTVDGGQERTDVVGALRQSYKNYGGSVQWTPSPRTTVLVQGEERYFGHGYRVVLEHRYARSSFRFVSSRDVSIGSDAVSQGQAVTLYELYFVQFAASIPDPVQRDQFVLGLIAATGRNRDELISTGLFGRGGVSVQERRELFWLWNGSRLTTSVSGFTLGTDRLDNGGVNPVARNDNIRQTGYAASLGWRLTPLTSVNASGSRTMTQETITLARSDLKAVSVGLATQIGSRATGVLGARYSVFNGSPESYREISLTGSISLRF